MAFFQSSQKWSYVYFSRCPCVTFRTREFIHSLLNCRYDFILLTPQSHWRGGSFAFNRTDQSRGQNCWRKIREELCFPIRIRSQSSETGSRGQSRASRASGTNRCFEVSTGYTVSSATNYVYQFIATMFDFLEPIKGV